MKDIREAVARVARRLFMARLLEREGKALFYGALLVVLAMALDKLIHFGVGAWVFPAVVVPLALLAGWLWTLQGRPTDGSCVPRWRDRRR